MIYIKTLNKSKYNILSIFSCLILIVVFVFGCVQYAHAETTDNYVYGEDSYTYINDTDPHIMAICVRNADRYDTIFVTNLMGRIAFLRKNVNGYYSFYMYTENIENSNMSMMIYNTCSFPKNGKYYSGFVSSSGPYNSYFNGVSFASYLIDNGELVSSNAIIFEDVDDLNTYLNTGEINNPIYQPKENVEFDSDIEIPLNLDIRLNGSSDFVPNVKISCNQTEQVEDRYLEVQYSIGYKATWTLLGGIGLNIKSKTSPTVYGSIEQLEESFDNGGTSFETIFPMTKISHSVAPGKEVFSQYEPTPKVYWSLKEIKNHNSEMKIWCRNRVGNKASKWVMVSGDSHKANFDVVSSDENGNPTDLKDDTANSNTGYGSDYWNNRDTTPQDEYSNVDVKTNLKDLKSNYSSLANFYKELFSFLPAEIWILLIGLVSTMVIIAIIRFVRG